MRRKTLEELRDREDDLVGMLLRLASKLESVRASRRRAEKRQEKETVRARYVETNALAVPCETCNVDKGAECQTSDGEGVSPHASRVSKAVLFALTNPTFDAKRYEPDDALQCECGHDFEKHARNRGGSPRARGICTSANPKGFCGRCECQVFRSVAP